ncbi:uncharacterized protein BDV14DRAFT_202078 [Aspergillus stella-maris]|uniref:uncharacterized protein n=1 Tax=Aspergillus stella-maris TaxID=1810926 RepID=UPI003CCD66F6
MKLFLSLALAAALAAAPQGTPKPEVMVYGNFLYQGASSTFADDGDCHGFNWLTLTILAQRPNPIHLSTRIARGVGLFNPTCEGQPRTTTSQNEEKLTEDITGVKCSYYT